MTLPGPDLDIPAPRRGRRLVFQFVKWSLFALVLALAVTSLSQQARKVDWSAVHIQALPIALAAGCLLAVPPVQLLSYRCLLGAYVSPPSLREMAVVAWIPPLGKYVPGASWVGAFYVLRRFGIPVPVGLSVIVAMDGLAVLTGLIVGVPLVGQFISHGWLITLPLVGAGLVCLHPAIFARLLNFALAKLGRAQLNHIPDARHYILPLVCAFIQWIVAGAALWLVSSAVGDVQVTQLPRFIEIAGLGYTIGYLVIFASAGLGPRDLIFQKAITPLIVPSAVAAVAVVIIRVVQTCTELCAAGAGLLIWKRLERSRAGEPSVSDQPGGTNPSNSPTIRNS